MTLWDVWVWSKVNDVPTSLFRRLYKKAFQLSVSRLVGAIWREDKWNICQVAHNESGCYLYFGRDAFIVTEVAIVPSLNALSFSKYFFLVADGRKTSIVTQRQFLIAMEIVTQETALHSQMIRIEADFLNSFANLLFNMLLYETSEYKKDVIEVAHCGHNYYPFPALRVGPSIADVTECSHVTGRPTHFPVYTLNDAVFTSTIYQNEAHCRGKWGCDLFNEFEKALIVVHPWQLKLSSVIQALISQGQMTCLGHVEAVPLASQRTVRLIASSIDIKLPVNATLTGEHRLIFRKNIEYSINTSSYIRRAINGIPRGRILFQYDDATIRHRNEVIAQHACMIVRSPAADSYGATIVPALNIFASEDHLQKFFTSNGGHLSSIDFMHEYMHNVILACLQAYCLIGLAVEPHLQNCLIGMELDRPSKLIIRDIDSIIVDKQAVCRSGHSYDGDLSAMPPLEDGAKRLMYALVSGHIVQVLLCFYNSYQIDLSASVKLFWSAWHEAVSDLAPVYQTEAKDLARFATGIKEVLIRRLRGDMDLSWRVDGISDAPRIRS